MAVALWLRFVNLMRLFIAEKPSLGRAIADVLPKPHRKGDGFIECGNGQVVTWCIGHLLEQAQPDAYDSRYARWNLADLPIVPEKWQLQPRPSVTKQLNVIKRFLYQAGEIIHAGDRIAKDSFWLMKCWIISSFLPKSASRYGVV